MIMSIVDEQSFCIYCRISLFTEEEQDGWHSICREQVLKYKPDFSIPLEFFRLFVRTLEFPHGRVVVETNETNRLMGAATMFCHTLMYPVEKGQEILYRTNQIVTKVVVSYLGLQDNVLYEQILDIENPTFLFSQNAFITQVFLSII